MASNQNQENTPSLTEAQACELIRQFNIAVHCFHDTFWATVIDPENAAISYQSSGESLQEAVSRVCRLAKVQP